MCLFIPISTKESIMPGEHYIGTKNNDLWLTDNENDMLEGREGADELHAGGGDDVIEGGAGNDILNGEGGGDVYLYRLGDGNDHIIEHSGSDTIRFDASVDVSKVRVVREGNHLKLVIQATPVSVHKIKVADWFLNAGSQVEKIEFTDISGNVILCWDVVTLRTLAQRHDQG
jgi:Ca2+-binding RTX toxin-like protein